MKRTVRLVVAIICAVGLNVAAHAGQHENKNALADYIERVRPGIGQPVHAESIGSLWSDGGFADLAADHKARAVGDPVTVNILEQTLAEASGSVATQRAFDASSGITGLAGRINTGGIATLFSANSNGKLQGQAQTASKSRLITSVGGQVAAVLPNGVLVIEVHRQLSMNNERQTITLRGLARPGDITPTNEILSTQLSSLEIDLRGKGIVSDATRRPNWIVRALLKLIGF